MEARGCANLHRPTRCIPSSTGLFERAWGEIAEREPILEGLAEFVIAFQNQLFGGDRFGNRHLPHPDFRQLTNICSDDKVVFEACVRIAKLNLFVLDMQPSAAPHAVGTMKLELDNDAWGRRQRVSIDVAVYIPQQHAA